MLSDYFLYMNPYQGKAKKALFVCTGGILRSPTAAHTAAEFYGWNTRSAGIYEEAVPQVNATLCDWAEVIYCLEREHATYLDDKFDCEYETKVIVLGIPDKFTYRDPELIRLIRLKLDEVAARAEVKFPYA
jgi:predicted protein tyrosine phosphatase